MWHRTSLAVCMLAAGVAMAPLHASATTLRVQLNADIRSIDPGVNRDATTDGVVLHIVEGLVGYNAQGLPKPLLAKQVDVSEDGLTYTFHLRENVKFHNGETLTSEDVLWSWNRYMDPKVGWRCLADFDGRKDFKVVSVQASDEHTVLFKLNHANPLFLTTMARGDCGMTGIVHRDSVRKDGTWDKPIGTGPFELKEWKHREYISLVRNPDYASPSDKKNDGYVGSKRPMVDEIRFLVIPDLATAKAALQQGNIDILTRLPYNEAAELSKAPRTKIYPSSTWGIGALLLQTSDPLLSDVKLRRAIASALDYGQLIANVTYGLATPNNSIVPDSSSYYTDIQKKGYVYNPAHVKQLLKESGYKGQPIKIIANKQYGYLFDAAVISQAMLQQAGINADIEVMEWGTQMDRFLKGNYQMMAFTYSPRMDPALTFDSLMGDRKKQPRKVWDDPEAAEILRKTFFETDRQARQALFDELHHKAIEQVPLVPLFNVSNIDAMPDNITGYHTSLFGVPRLWEVSKE